MLELLKMLASLVLLIALGLFILMVFKRHFKSASTTLYAEGYILTHPERKAVAFDNATDTRRYYSTCLDAGIQWTCHALYKGKLTQVEIGDTIIY